MAVDQSHVGSILYALSLNSVHIFIWSRFSNKNNWLYVYILKVMLFKAVQYYTRVSCMPLFATILRPSFLLNHLSTSALPPFSIRFSSNFHATQHKCAGSVCVFLLLLPYTLSISLPPVHGYSFRGALPNTLSRSCMLHLTLSPFLWWDLSIVVLFIAMWLKKRNSCLLTTSSSWTVSVIPIAVVERMSLASPCQTFCKPFRPPYFLRRRPCFVRTHYTKSASAEVYLTLFDSVGRYTEEEGIGQNSYTLFSVYVSNCIFYFLRCVRAIHQQPPPCCHSLFVSEHISTKGTLHFLVGALLFSFLTSLPFIMDSVSGRWLRASGRSSKCD